MFTRSVLALAALPLALGGCGALGLSTATPTWSPTPAPNPNSSPWIITAQGSVPPSPNPSGGAGSRPPLLPPVSFLANDRSCAQDWQIGVVLIPIQVTPGKGKLSMTWPRQYDSNYRITAVPQPLIKGNQPNYTWQNITPGSGCTISGTITGLKSGKPYIVWLDAPATGYQADGTRHLYSGRTGVVYPL
jgi:hypothetical protein